MRRILLLRMKSYSQSLIEIYVTPFGGSFSDNIAARRYRHEAIRSSGHANAGPSEVKLLLDRRHLLGRRPVLLSSISHWSSPPALLENDQLDMNVTPVWPDSDPNNMFTFRPMMMPRTFVTEHHAWFRKVKAMHYSKVRRSLSLLRPRFLDEKAPMDLRCRFLELGPFRQSRGFTS